MVEGSRAAVGWSNGEGRWPWGARFGVGCGVVAGNRVRTRWICIKEDARLLALMKAEVAG
jgi:hypothetical protein